MEPDRLTILGAGSVRCAPPILGSLASYYGERPLEVRLYDADAERLDLFDLLARVVVEDTNVEHGVRSYADPVEALEGAHYVVLAVGENCARKYLRQAGRVVPVDAYEARREAVIAMLDAMPPDAIVLNLLPPEISIPVETYYRVAWPPDLDEDARRAVPLQVLRWLHREDTLYDLIEANDRSPFKRWLDDPSSAEFVVGTRV